MKTGKQVCSINEGTVCKAKQNMGFSSMASGGKSACVRWVMCAWFSAPFRHRHTRTRRQAGAVAGGKDTSPLAPAQLGAVPPPGLAGLQRPRSPAGSAVLRAPCCPSAPTKPFFPEQVQIVRIRNTCPLDNPRKQNKTKPVQNKAKVSTKGTLFAKDNFHQ